MTHSPAPRALVNRTLRPLGALLLWAALCLGPTASAGLSKQSLPVDLGNVIVGELSQPVELERFTFSGPVGQRIYYDSLNPTNRAGWNMRLIAPNGEQERCPS